MLVNVRACITGSLRSVHCLTPGTNLYNIPYHLTAARGRTVSVHHHLPPHPVSQVTCAGAAQLNLARNGTLSVGTGVAEGKGKFDSTIRAYSIDEGGCEGWKNTLDDAIAEEYGSHFMRRRSHQSPAPLAHS